MCICRCRCRYYTMYVKIYYVTGLMGLSLRTTQWRYTEWLKFNQGNNKTGNAAVYPYPDWSDVHGLELYNHSNNTADSNDFNAQDNFNFSYEQNMKNTVDQLHNILKETWENQTWSIKERGRV